MHLKSVLYVTRRCTFLHPSVISLFNLTFHFNLHKCHLKKQTYFEPPRPAHVGLYKKSTQMAFEAGRKGEKCVCCVKVHLEAVLSSLDCSSRQL